jgi:hypothetical protein
MTSRGGQSGCSGVGCESDDRKRFVRGVGLGWATEPHAFLSDPGSGKIICPATYYICPIRLRRAYYIQ